MPAWLTRFLRWARKKCWPDARPIYQKELLTMSKKESVSDALALITDEMPRTLYERVGDYLAGKEWNYSSDAERHYYSLHLRLKHGSVRIVIDTAQNEEWQRVLVYSIYPTLVPETRRTAVCEALARINFTLGFGSFEMDLKDGEVRVRTWLECEGEMPESQIDRAMRKSVDLAEQYMAALLAVAFGNVAATDIVELASSGDGQTLQ
jgi:hypothetical protein